MLSILKIISDEEDERLLEALKERVLAGAGRPEYHRRRSFSLLLSVPCD